MRNRWTVADGCSWAGCMQPLPAAHVLPVVNILEQIAKRLVRKLLKAAAGLER